MGEQIRAIRLWDSFAGLRLVMPRRTFLLFPVPDSAQPVIIYLVNSQLKRRIKIKEKIAL